MNRPPCAMSKGHVCCNNLGLSHLFYGTVSFCLSGVFYLFALTDKSVICGGGGGSGGLFPSHCLLNFGVLSSNNGDRKVKGK